MAAIMELWNRRCPDYGEEEQEQDCLAIFEREDNIKKLEHDQASNKGLELAHLFLCAFSC